MGSEFYDARDWEKELEDAKKALAAALKRERSWEGEAKSLKRLGKGRRNNAARREEE